MTSVMDTLPAELDAEKAVLSVMLQEPEEGRAEQAAEYGVRPDWFSAPAHGSLFAALQRLAEAGEPLEMVTAPRALGAELMEDLGGASGLYRLYAEAPTGAYFERHLEMLASTYLRRQTVLAAHRAIAEAAETTNGHQCAENARRAFERLSGDHIGGDLLTPHAEALGAAVGEICDRASQETLAVVETPWWNVNSALSGGLGIGEITFVAARPSCGKTSFGLNLVTYAAEAGTPAAFVSLESGISRLAARVLAASSGIPVSRLTKEACDIEELTRVRDGLDRSRDLPIWWSKLHNGAHPQVCQAIRQAARKGCRLVVVDYLQKLRATDRAEQDDMRLRMDNALDAICPLADSLGIALVICTQLNRTAEGMRGSKLHLGMLKETSRVEQDGDVVLMIGPGDHEPDRAECSPMTISIPKVRDGRTAILNMELHGPTTTFHAS